MSAAERNELAIPATLQFDIRLPELPGATGIGMNDSAPNERELFIQLLELQTASERQAFLERHCGSNTTLGARLLELLTAHQEAGNFLQGEREPARKGQYSEADSNAMISEGPGSAIGRCKLLEKIGEGGFGIVYLAEQRAPVKRRVALKIIKLGMDTREVVGRFEAERQALALMDHPHIAKVLDAGAAEIGRHYLHEEYKQRRAAELADRETRKARQLAEREAAVARAVVQFLNEDIFTGADPAVHPDRGFTVEDLLQRARLRVGERFAGQPLVAAAVRHTLATTLYTLGDFRSALEQVELAYQLRLEHLGSDARETLDSMVMLAWLTGTELNWQTGRELAEEAVDRATTAFGRSHPATLDGMSRLAWIYYRNRETKSECRELIAETVQLARESPGVSPRVFLSSLQLHGRMDRPGEGEELFREALDYARQSLGHHHPWTVNARAALAAYLYDWTDKMDEAEEHCRAALLDHIRMFGESHPNSLVIRANLKLILWKQQRWQEVLQHELKHFELARHPLKNLEHLKESLNNAPLADAGGKVQWSSTRVAPDPGWTMLNYNGAGWRPDLPSRAAQVWLRGHLKLAAPGAWTPRYILRSSGIFSIWINGVPANPQPPHSDGTMQILAPDRQARASLRAGPNVIAIQGEGLNPSEPLEIEILEGPALGENLYPAGLPLDSM